MQRTVTTKSATPEKIANEHGIDLGHELTKGLAGSLIKQKARQLARRAGFSKSDIDDIKQQFVQRILENMHAFDASQGHFNVFATTVIERFAANILRDARAEKRDQRETRSLSTVVGEDDNGPVHLGDTISSDDPGRRLGTNTRDAAESASLAMDVEMVMAQLPNDLREICEKLKHQSPVEVARDLGLTWSAMRVRLRKLQETFKAAALEEYF